MLDERLFTENDAYNLKKSYKAHKMASYLLLIIMIPIIFLISYIISMQVPYIFLPFALVFVSLLLVSYYLAFFKRLKLMKQDIASQTKLVGSLQVTSKSERNKRLFIGFDSQDLEKLYLNKGIFDKIGIGDTLSLEIAEYSHSVFIMSRGDELLMGKGTKVE